MGALVGGLAPCLATAVGTGQSYRALNQLTPAPLVGGRAPSRSRCSPHIGLGLLFLRGRRPRRRGALGEEEEPAASFRSAGVPSFGQSASVSESNVQAVGPVLRSRGEGITPVWRSEPAGRHEKYRFRIHSGWFFDDSFRARQQTHGAGMHAGGRVIFCRGRSAALRPPGRCGPGTWHVRAVDTGHRALILKAQGADPQSAGRGHAMARAGPLNGMCGATQWHVRSSYVSTEEGLGNFAAVVACAGPLNGMCGATQWHVRGTLRPSWHVRGTNLAGWWK